VTSISQSLGLAGLLLSLVAPVWAEGEQPRSLTTLQPDPLLPNPALQRSLSPLERRAIQKTIVQLDQEAQALLAADQGDQAFDHWFRVLNLQRALGRSEEIKGLGRIGEYAWKNARNEDLQIITDRLHTLETTFRDTPQQLLSIDAMALGKAYQQVRDLNAAQTFYEFQLDIAQIQQDIPATQALLGELVQVHWGALQYSLAVEYTQQQLELLRSFPVTPENLEQERSLLIALAFLAKQSGDSETEIGALEEAIALTLDLGLRPEIPNLLTTLAQAQQKVGQSNLAIENYQKAYRFAQQNQQFESAQNILFSLGQLQEQKEQFEDAIQTYELLRQVHRYSSNLLGLLDSYDRLGQLYLQVQQPTKAQEQFQQGLTLAKRLRYREAEFESYLQQF
jgi:tetratricopeptide (TPR) repeat protein